METDDVYVRTEDVCGVKEWYWLKGETGAWAGPSQEFQPLADVCLKHAPGRDLVVTAGGCLGMYPRLWTRYFKHVVTAEPDPLNFSVLEMNCPGDQYTRLCAALGSEEGTARFCQHGRDNVGMHNMTRIDEGKVSFDVKVVTVDSLKLEHLDVLQLDVEGYEMRVLLGADSSIRRFRPVISVETLTGDITAFFESHSYQKVGRSASDTIFAPR